MKVDFGKTQVYPHPHNEWKWLFWSTGWAGEMANISSERWSLPMDSSGRSAPPFPCRFNVVLSHSPTDRPNSAGNHHGVKPTPSHSHSKVLPYHPFHSSTHLWRTTHEFGSRDGKAKPTPYSYLCLLGCSHSPQACAWPCAGSPHFISWLCHPEGCRAPGRVSSVLYIMHGKEVSSHHSNTTGLWNKVTGGHIKTQYTRVKAATSHSLCLPRLQEVPRCHQNQEIIAQESEHQFKTSPQWEGGNRRTVTCL